MNLSWTYAREARYKNSFFCKGTYIHFTCSVKTLTAAITQCVSLAIQPQQIGMSLHVHMLTAKEI